MAVDGIATGVTVILKKLSSVVADEITLLWDFKDKLKNLQITLNMILAIMEDAEEKQASDPEVRLWMEELKAIAYDAEDILDEYCYEVILWKREKEDNSTFFNKVCNLCSNSSTSFVCSLNLSHQIKEINERFNKIVKRKNDLGLQRIYVGSSPSSHAMMMMNRETYSLVAANWKIVGRENDKSKIINTLLDKDSCLVLSIVGLGGMGKTTVAQLVYNDEAIKNHFQLKIWICVSDPFDVKKVLKKIVNSIGTYRRYDDAATMEDIVLGLQDALRKKKFLLVLDDVWNENSDDWYILKTPLMVGVEGSKILVTTRSVEVASIMVDNFPPYPLGILNDNDSWSLFKEIAFGSAAGAVETQELVKIGKEMVERCRGLPLAVIFLGSLMRSKKKEDEWKKIRDTKIWHESHDGKKSKHGILPSLRLSYDYLPSYLKPCFSYCCLFPKDSIIEREKLIRLWMAEGFLIKTPRENATSMEEIGNEYFHSLLCNFFFQDVTRNKDGDIETCKMHDLVHDLARSIVGKNECLIVESAYDIGLISETTRRLNLLVNLDDKEILPRVLEALKKATKLRTILFNDQEFRFDMVSENKRLRVLDLRWSDFEESTYSSIGGLKHLRYVDVTGNGYRFPKGVISRLSFLQTWACLEVGDKKENKNACGIEELEGLNLLTGDLCITDLQNVTSGTDAYKANLKEKKILRLELSWEGDNHAINNHEDVLEGLRPHPSLRTLKIEGFEGAKLPRWIQEDLSSCLPNLEKLDLSSGIYKQVAGFGALPSLRFLKLFRVKELECIGNDFYFSAAGGGGSSSSFPSLKRLILSGIPLLKEWVVPPPPPASTTTTGKHHCFPLLEEISIWRCPLLSTITPTIFPSLKVLSLEDIDESVAKTLVINNLKTLTYLELFEIRNLITLPRRGLLENNNTLLSLSICYCSKFEGFFPPNKDDDDDDHQEGGGQQLQQMSQVISSSSTCSSSSSSSSSSLQSLRLYNCPALRFYLDIRSLTSLRELEIQECKESKSLLDELTYLPTSFFSSLDHLEHVKFLKNGTATRAILPPPELVFDWRKSSTVKK